MRKDKLYLLLFINRQETTGKLASMTTTGSERAYSGAHFNKSGSNRTSLGANKGAVLWGSTWKVGFLQCWKSIASIVFQCWNEALLDPSYLFHAWRILIVCLCVGLVRFCRSRTLSLCRNKSQSKNWIEIPSAQKFSCSVRHVVQVCHHVWSWPGHSWNPVFSAWVPRHDDKGQRISVVELRSFNLWPMGWSSGRCKCPFYPFLLRPWTLRRASAYYITVSVLLGIWILNTHKQLENLTSRICLLMNRIAPNAFASCVLNFGSLRSRAPFGPVSVHQREIKGETWRVLSIENARVAPTPCLATWRESCGTRSLPSSSRSLGCVGQAGGVHVHHESRIIDINPTTKIEWELWVLMHLLIRVQYLLWLLWGHDFWYVFLYVPHLTTHTRFLAIEIKWVLMDDSHRSDTTLHQLKQPDLWIVLH